jgi:hypothetical protein
VAARGQILARENRHLRRSRDSRRERLSGIPEQNFTRRSRAAHVEHPLQPRIVHVDPETKQELILRKTLTRFSARFFSLDED